MSALESRSKVATFNWNKIEENFQNENQYLNLIITVISNLSNMQKNFQSKNTSTNKHTRVSKMIQFQPIHIVTFDELC